MHTCTDCIYANGVGITLSVYNQGCGRPRTAKQAEAEIPPLFHMWLNSSGHQSNKSGTGVYADKKTTGNRCSQNLS